MMISTCIAIGTVVLGLAITRNVGAALLAGAGNWITFGILEFIILYFNK